MNPVIKDFVMEVTSCMVYLYIHIQPSGTFQAQLIFITVIMKLIILTISFLFFDSLACCLVANS